MKQKLKDFCEHELMIYHRFGGDKKAMIDRCYGAMMFCINDSYDSDIANWWDDEMLPKLNKA